MTDEPVLLAIPNVSEGCDLETVVHIAGHDALLDVHSDPDHNRSVLTYGGTPAEVVDALDRMVDTAARALDINRHEGAHPRYGVVDVLPFVAYRVSEETAERAMGDLAWRIAQGSGVPVHFYGRGYETLPGLRRALRTNTHTAHPTAGVICMGIRDPLIAFNVNLDAPLAEARRIALEIRSPEIRTLAFELPSRGLVQVSMNLVAPQEAGPRKAFEAVAERSDAVVDAEVVGLVPDELLPDLDGLPLRSQARGIADALTQGSPG